MHSSARKNDSSPFEFWKELNSDATICKNSSSEVATVKRRAVTLKPQIQGGPPLRPLNSHSPTSTGSSLTRSTSLQGGIEGKVKLQPATASSDSKWRPPSLPGPPAAAYHGVLNKDDYRKKTRSGPSISHSSSLESPIASSVEVQRKDFSARKETSSSKSDAGSYTPGGRCLFGSVSLRKSPGHSQVGKVLSSPEQGYSAQKSSSLDCSSQVRTKKFVPKISTIRGSTGDRLSMDDMDLYCLQKTGKVQDLAKQMDSVLLTPQQSSTSRETHRSAGDINMTGTVIVIVIFVLSNEVV